VAKHRKVYRFRMRPDAEQGHALNRMAGARRFVWNWALARWKETYAATGKSISLGQLSAELTALKAKPETAWLSECDSQALQQVLKDLHRAFANFFERRARYPRFKSKKRDKARFRIPQRVKVADGKVYVPKVGWVRIRQSRDVDGTTKSATFSREADGHWYVAIVVEFEMPDVAITAIDPSKAVGLDLGLIDFVTTSDATEKPIPAPKFYRKAAAKIRRAQKAVSRRKLGSRRRDKARKRLALAHRKARDQRNDFLHKLSTDLVGRHEAICIEDLNVKGLARTKLAKSFSDAAMGEFRRQLEYKCSWDRRALVAVDRFFPSSKMCDRCGALNDRLSLSDREWDCDCGAHHKRDFLAACNIRDEGLRMLAVGQTESPKRSGSRCKTRAIGLSASN
jgi:putative transposase